MPKRTTTRPLRGKNGKVFTTHDILTVHEFRGMQPGDRVIVTGKDGKKLPGKFEFHSYQVNLRTGKAWLQVHGGIAARAILWPYAISQVRKS